jgi:hypothetical protein
MDRYGRVSSSGVIRALLVNQAASDGSQYLTGYGIVHHPHQWLRTDLFSQRHLRDKITDSNECGGIRRQPSDHLIIASRGTH